MPKECAKPQIRFAGFDDTWEQRKLGELVERVVRKNTNNESTLPLTISAQYGLVDQIIYFNNRVASRDVTNYYLVLNGEFAYNKSTSDGFPFGVVKRLDLYEKGVLSTLYIVFSIKNQPKTNSNFLTIFFDTDRWHKGVSERAAEGARNHGLLNISAEDFFDIDLYLPKSEKEQVVIGAYFKNLDHLITLHQSKYNKLTNIKKSMLEKMFPKNDSNVPEIRFKGFSGDWERRKLSDILTLLKDGTHGTHKDAESGPLLLSAKNIKNGVVQWDDTDRRISEDEYENIHANFQLNTGDVLLTIVGSIGQTAILNHSKGITFQRSVAFLRPTKELQSEFLYSEIQGSRFQKELNDRKSTSAQPGIYLGDLGEILVDFPADLMEQQQIADYFHNLDKLITLQQCKLEKLKNLKKACLEKMFV